MATVFRRKSSGCWIASFKRWEAAKGVWKWRSQSTGLYDEAPALSVALVLERAASAAAQSKITRARALEWVNDILKAAGQEAVKASPSLAEFVKSLLAEKMETVTKGTMKKYNSQWTSLREWAGDKAGWPVDHWEAPVMTAYYEHLKGAHSQNTANDHLRFSSMVFERARELGYTRVNPVEAVSRVGGQTIEKETFDRGETAALFRAIRKEKDRAKRFGWLALCGLGWHTGHRIQDLLDVTHESLEKHQDLGWLVTLRPAKRARQKSARIVVLPIPTWLARLIKRIKSLTALRGGDNTSGRVSGDFIVWLKAAGIDPLPVKAKHRTVHRKSFHSNRHSMTTRLVMSGVSGEVARLVTDHTSPTVHRRYVHSEIEAIKEALQQARGKRGTKGKAA